MVCSDRACGRDGEVLGPELHQHAPPLPPPHPETVREEQGGRGRPAGGGKQCGAVVLDIRTNVVQDPYAITNIALSTDCSRLVVTGQTDQVTSRN